MEENKKYKKQLREIIFSSIDNNIKNWTKSKYYDVYDSPYFDDFQFKINVHKKTVELSSIDGTYIICIYANKLFVSDIKMWVYQKKLKKYFNNTTKMSEIDKESNILKSSIMSYKKSNIKYDRKEKIKKLNK